MSNRAPVYRVDNFVAFSFPVWVALIAFAVEFRDVGNVFNAATGSDFDLFGEINVPPKFFELVMYSGFIYRFERTLDDDFVLDSFDDAPSLRGFYNGIRVYFLFSLGGFLDDLCDADDRGFAF